MGKFVGSLASLLLLIGCLAAPGRASAELQCKMLGDIALTRASVTKITVETLGEAKACKFNVTAKPTEDSDIRIEVWVPIGAAWNGKFVQVGNGGFAGQIPTGFLKAMAERGYAAAGTDDGHQTIQPTDAGWALGHPQKLEDYGWRAVKQTTDIAKMLILAQKGSGPAKSYFAGCSDGGREALMSAQRFPDDFDGIVAGAPAANFTHLLATAAWTEQANLRAPASYIGPPQLAVLQAAALRQCGEGGIIRDPMSCRFDPGVTLCRPDQDSSSCLSAAQVAAARAIYGGPRTPDGRRLFVGYTPGAEAAPGGWQTWITGPSYDNASSALIYQFGSGFFQYMAFSDPTYDILRLSFGGEFQSAKARTSAALDAVNPNLRAFRAHGGKLIQYHGWNDAGIPALSSVVYYEDVRAKMGDVSDFYRLFMIPGMLHCGGGPGPGTVDWLSVLDTWVVRGVAPDQLTATNAPSPYAPPPTEPVRPRSQLICPYPQVARRGLAPADSAMSCTWPVIEAPPAPKPGPAPRPKPEARR
jgi:feruloyl esterase